jgi:hypothetical protein
MPGRSSKACPPLFLAKVKITAVREFKKQDFVLASSNTRKLFTYLCPSRFMLPQSMSDPRLTLVPLKQGMALPFSLSLPFSLPFSLSSPSSRELPQ